MHMMASALAIDDKIKSAGNVLISGETCPKHRPEE